MPAGRPLLSWPMSEIPINIAELVGGTPLVGLPRMLEGTPAAENGVELFAKLEAFNPGGSVKDRIGVAMIEAAEAEGRIEPGRTTIVEATSGNTGIALAFVCAAKGYELVLTLPQGMSRERESLLRLYGARVEITESLGGMGEAVAAARAMARERRRVPARPVLQPRQPGGPPAHDRTGDRARARRARRRARRGRRHRRHDHRRRRVPARARQPGSAGRGGRAARLGGAVRRRAGPAPHPGHRRRLRAAGAQPRAARRGDRRQRRRRDPDRVELRQARGPARGHLLRRRAVGRRCRSPRAPSPGASGSSSIMPDSGERYVSQAFFAP